MADKILLIGENPQSFLIKALTKTLSDASYEVEFCLPEPAYIDSIWAEKEDDFPEIIILYLERIEDSGNKFFPYIKNFMQKNGKKRRLYFIGNAVEIKQAYESIDRIFVKYAFERPVEAQDLLKTLNRDGGDYSFSESIKEYDIDAAKKTILVVDDETIQLHAMERWLSKTYNVLTEKSGNDAIALLQRYKVDMILLDYEMPVLSGYEVFQLIKADPSTEKIPVVFLTANDDSEIVKQVLAAKPVGYLLKNTPPLILVQKIDTIFQNLSKPPAKKRPY